ncbi:MAG: ABC transporter ATP-binding protein [Reyranellaceae bacterium]
MTSPLLVIDNLRTEFHSEEGSVSAVQHLSMALAPGETLGIVGESGCGKSVTALSIMRLLPRNAGITQGRICIDGRDLSTLTEAEMRKVRGNEIGMIFQEPMTSLNPVLTIGRQLAEATMLHRGWSRREADERALEMLNLVRIPDAERRLKEYPHQLSGGMRQRVMIAIALSCEPRVLIADEPTTALDVTIQAQILSLISELQRKLGTAVLLITHDLGVVAHTCSRVIVMYAGRKVEEAAVVDLFTDPLHPYTRGLLGSVPHLSDGMVPMEARLTEIPGIVPAPGQILHGCAFATRCTLATDRCRAEEPPLVEHELGHFAACWAVAA